MKKVTNNDCLDLQEVEKIYQDVSEWLKFAEAKHAGLFAVWVAALSMTVTLDVSQGIAKIFQIALIAAICIGILIELFAFFPFLNRRSFLKRMCYKKYGKYGGNAVFYQSVFIDTFSNGNINAAMDKYMEILRRKGLKTDSCELMKDYVRQIIEVAETGTIKIYLFSIAAKYSFLVVLSAVVMLIIA